MVSFDLGKSRDFPVVPKTLPFSSDFPYRFEKVEIIFELRKFFGLSLLDFENSQATFNRCLRNAQLFAIHAVDINSLKCCSWRLCSSEWALNDLELKLYRTCYSSLYAEIYFNRIVSYKNSHLREENRPVHWTPIF